VAKTYVQFIGTAQAGWVVLFFLPLNDVGLAIGALIVSIIDWCGPSGAEAKGLKHGHPTPWHAHHIAERFSLVAIIALGETVIGTLSAAQAITASEGWSVASIAVIGLGVIMTFALWWVYFLVPSAPILAVRRSKALLWGGGHIVIFGAIAAVGAGLHVIGYLYDEHYHVSTLTAITSVSLPVLVFMVGLKLIHTWLLGKFPPNSPLQLAVVALPLIAIAMAAIGWPFWACLLTVALSPVAIVLSYEAGEWRALQAQLDHVVQ
jgi:low temperature requirement protein LtrA